MHPSISCDRFTKRRCRTPKSWGWRSAPRSDCVPDDVLDLLEQLAAKTYLSVEYGMQTIHNRTLDWDESW